MIRSRWGRFAAPVVLAALLAAACGGGSDDKNASSKKTSAADETTTTVESTTTSSTDTTVAVTSTTAAKTTATTRKVANASATRNQANVGATRQLSSTETTLPPDLNKPPADWNPDGELRIAYAGPPSTLDPIALGALCPYICPLYERLTELGDDYTVKPRLASGWSYPDSKTMLVKLRTDARFHDGTPIDATAVKINLDRARNTPTSQVRASYVNVTAVDVVDPATVKITLSKGGAELPVTFSTVAGAIVNPKAIQDTPTDIATKGAGGSGPYKVDTVKIGDSVVYARNADFWDKREGLLKKMTVGYIANGPQRLNALRAGDMDYVQVIQQDVPGARKDSTIKGTLANLTATQVNLQLRDTLPPLDNAKVREAIAWAIDKDSLNNGLYSGTCLPASQFFLDSHWSHAKAVDGRYKFDKAKAKALLAESGVKDLSMTIQYQVIYQAVAEATQQMLNDVGFDVKLELATTGDTNFRDGKRPAFIGTIPGVLDPSQLINTILLGVNNLMRDPEGPALAAQGTDPAGNPASWALAYQKLWEKTYNNFLIVTFCNAQQFWAHTGKVANSDDLRNKFSGLVDWSYLYVKK
jgi:peptide/nickel transport system substrate-binding protein